MFKRVLRPPQLLGGLIVFAALSSTASAQVRLSAEAYSGGRFGVGRVTLDLPRAEVPAGLGLDGIGIDDRDGRVLYPVIEAREPGKLATEILEATPVLGPRSLVPPEVGGLIRGVLDKPAPTHVYFLFTGDDPLDVTVRARTAMPLRVVPQHDPEAHRELLDAWWTQYTAGPAFLEKDPDYPPLVKNYQASTLARRLSLELPEHEQTESWQDRLAEELGVLLASEEVRIAMQQDRILGLTNLHLSAELPRPQPPEVEPLDYPAAPDDVQIEPITARVPVECFYVRFGRYENFLWAQDTLARWGGDLKNLLAGRGISHGLTEKIQDQLVIRQSAMTRLLGPSTVDDVALIGADTFFREGAAFGLLFLARSSTAVGTSISGQRAARLAAGGVEEDTVQIAGHEVSYLHSPDGSARSYYAVDGDFHFVCTSRRLVERFFETASGEGALGDSPGLAHARATNPVSDDVAVFIYLSDEFFRHFTGPHYRVEMARRLQAAADVDLVQLATLAAATEGKPGGSIDELIRAEALPHGFGPRPDGSRAVFENGQVYDSLRGHQGAFTPIPDVPVERITKAEQTAYRRFVDFYREEWGGRMDPTVASIRREALGAGRERVVIDGRLSPFLSQHYESLSRFAGPPSDTRVAKVEGDLIAADVVLHNQRIFGGLVDAAIPASAVEGGLARLVQLRQWLFGYLGSVGDIGVLRVLDAQIPAPPDANGYARNAVGLWRREVGPYTVFSLHPEILARVTPQLGYVEAERPAQLWLRVEDPSEARITGFLNAWGYRRSRDTTLGNLRLLADLDQQLRVPPGDCLAAAEFLLGAKLVCPLGGEYVVRETPAGRRWTSTALEGADLDRRLRPQPPAGYVAPIVSWLRGLKLDARMTEQVLSLHADVVMETPE